MPTVQFAVPVVQFAVPDVQFAEPAVHFAVPGFARGFCSGLRSRAHFGRPPLLKTGIQIHLRPVAPVNLPLVR